MLNKSFFFQQGRQRPRGVKFRVNTSLVATGTSDANTYRIQFSSNFSGQIIWGDGVVEVKTGFTQIVSHIYAVAGIYDIEIIPNPGSIAHIRLRDDFSKLLKFIDFGTYCRLDQYCFQNCTNADLSEVLGIPLLEGELLGVFQNFKGNPIVNNSDLWDFGKATNIFSFFNNSTINSPFNIKSTTLTNASYFLFAANNFTSQINLNAPNLTTFTNAVQNNTSFNQDISGWIINKNANITSFMQGKTAANFSAENYDKALTMFKNTFVGTGRTETIKSANFGTIKRTAVGTTMRDALVADGWTWTDGGQI